MSTLNLIEKQPFEELLRMSGGYVLDFTDATFASFFYTSVQKDIHDVRYTKFGASKAKKLRAFWDIEPDPLVAKLLGELIELWEYQNPAPTAEEQSMVKRCRDIIARLAERSRQSTESAEDVFLRKDFDRPEFRKMSLDGDLVLILENRFEEAERCLDANAPLAAIFMCGSVLEGLLLGVAHANPQRFNQASFCPKDSTTGKVKPFQEWKLGQLIDVAHDRGFLTLDIKKFSHELRDFRNYIHPNAQWKSEFTPSNHTAKICKQVLLGAIACLNEERTP